MLFHIKLFKAKTLDQIVDLTDEYVFNGKLEKIIEITYSYRETGNGYLFNETLFEEFLGIEYNGEDIDLLGRKTKYKIGVQIIMIDDIIKKSEKIKTLSRNLALRRSLFIEALEYVKTILSISIEGVDFEMQKAGGEQKLTKVQTKKKIKTIEKLEKQAFGGKTIDDSEEFSRSYHFINEAFQSKKTTLIKKDQIKMTKYIKSIESAAKGEKKEIQLSKTKQLTGKFLTQTIPRKEYRKIFDTICEFYSLPQRTKLTSAGSIYDGDKFLEIPRDSDYAYFTVERLLKLITHEIESHYINAHNGRILLGNFRGAKNLFKEEGLAIFMEKIFVGCSYEDINSASGSLLRVISGEVLDGKEFKEFLRIRNMLLGIKTDHSNAFIRSKRNYPFGLPGVQHKDVVYFRGLTDTIKYLQSGGEFRKLFFGKVGFHDLENLSDIYDRYEDKSDIVFPIFISDLIYYYLSEIQKDSIFVFNSQKYYLYLKKKYWFLDLDAFKVIVQIDTKWKKIEKILNIFEKAVK